MTKIAADRFSPCQVLISILKCSIKNLAEKYFHRIKMTEKQAHFLAQTKTHNDSEYFIANWQAPYSDESVEKAYLKLLLWRKRIDPQFQWPDLILAIMAKERWQKQSTEWLAKGIDSTIAALMNAKSFDEAERVARNHAISHDSFSGSIYCLSAREKFHYTKHTHQILPENLVKKNKPTFLYIEDKKIMAVKGNHELSDGELKKLITDRKVMCIHDFQKEDEWHLFYFTYRDIKGEHWKTEHIHYCSSYWQKSKKEALEELSKKTHRIRSVHLQYALNK